MRLAFAILALSTIAAAAQNAASILPDLSKTPGPADPRADVCNSAFSTKALRRARKSDRRCVLSRYGGKPHVCNSGDISLVDAQNLVRRNWIAGYARFVTPKGSPICETNPAPNS